MKHVLRFVRYHLQLQNGTNTQIRFLSVEKAQQVTIEPVKLAYSSYESTGGILSQKEDNTQNINSPPPLLIMHGLFGSKSNWNSLSKFLHENTEPKRKVVSLDARNHGDSPHTPVHTYDHMVEDIRALMDDLELEKASLLGHSMGGRAMMLFSLKYPERVEKMIVADISPMSTSMNLKTVPTLFTSLQKITLPTNIPISLAKCSADIQLSETVIDKGLRSFLLTNLVQKNDGSFTWRVNIEALKNNFNEHLAGFPQIKDLSFTGPVLFVDGSSSNFIEKSDHPAIRKLFPNAEFKYLNSACQSIHCERPKEFLTVCLEFLNRYQTCETENLSQNQ